MTSPSLDLTALLDRPTEATPRKPRLGFLGVGWIGRNRMAAIVKSDLATVPSICDQSAGAAAEAAMGVTGATVADTYDDLLSADLDGIVIATPSAQHADQAIAALERGIAVFCQKPLARNAAETRRVLDAARANDRLLAVDLSYRFTAGMQRIREIIASSELGRVYAVDLVFHNAYGPDKPWFFDPALSGGGCVIDLGIHLVDLAFWTLGRSDVTAATSRLFTKGEPLRDRSHAVEDFATARLELGDDTVVQLSCSWNLPAGCDAVIGATFYGTRGGAALRNVNGSFHDFVAERYRGTTRETLSTPPDDWGGRAAVAWARQLATSNRFDPAVESLIDVATALDLIYDR